MARNFGLRPANPSDRTPVWPFLAVTIVAIGVINAALFLHHR